MSQGPTRRNRPSPCQLRLARDTGWFLDASISETNFEFLIDTGASCTLVDTTVFQNITLKQDIELQPCQTEFSMADGSPLEVAGEFVTPILIAGKTFSCPIVVAELGGISGLLGLDFMEMQGAVLNLAKGELKISSTTVQLHKEDNRGCCRVQMTHTVTIPARSEMTIKGQIMKRNDTAMRIGAIEGTKTLFNGSGVMMAKAVVNAENKDIPLTIMNPQDQPITLQRGKTVGLLHPVTLVQDVSGGVDKEVNKEKNLPDHLSPILDDTKGVLNTEQQEMLKDLLLEYEDVFAAPGGQLGKTDKVKHTINTGGAVPIKEAPRRLPWTRLETVDKEVDKMLEQGVIEPSNSPADSCLFRRCGGLWKGFPADST